MLIKQYQENGRINLEHKISHIVSLFIQTNFNDIELLFNYCSLCITSEGDIVIDPPSNK